MSERRFTPWQVVLAVGIALFICTGSFGAGTVFGFLWGRDRGVASLVREPLRRHPPVGIPVEPWPFQGVEPQVPPEPAIPSGRAYLGVVYQTVTPELAEQHELDVDSGAFIVEVVEGSPAQEGGLRAGDVILAVDGDRVDSRATLTDRLLPYSPGDTVELTILRRGKQTEVVVTLGEAQRQEP